MAAATFQIQSPFHVNVTLKPYFRNANVLALECTKQWFVAGYHCRSITVTNAAALVTGHEYDQMRYEIIALQHYVITILTIKSR